MALRCLLFSSHEEIVQPILQVLTDLGIEGEHCQSAVDAVERVTTQLFQIVITDWDDQPEAAFLLKTARDLKAAARPLTLAIVGEDARPEALRAGANSVLLKPIRPEQVRDTMSTACQLLRAKQQSPTQPPSLPTGHRDTQPAAPLAAAATASAAAAPAAAFVAQAAEKLRTGEFLQSSGSAPGAQFDTEKESGVQESLDRAAIAEVDALTELEPMAAAVQDAPAAATQAAEPQEPLTGWAALQARLTKPAPVPPVAASTKNELLSYGETAASGSQSAEKNKDHGSTPAHAQAESEAALFSYVSGEPQPSSEPADHAPSKRGKLILAAILGVACTVVAAVPRLRQSLPPLYRNAMHAGKSWLNPPPGPLPQAVAQHDSFGQSGDEYKLPVPTNIPDATTDPSQIQVLPVIDPTAKPDKNAAAAAAAAQAQPTTAETPTDQNQTDQNVPVEQKVPSATAAADLPANTTAPAVTTAPPAQTPAPILPPPQAVVPQPVAAPIRPSTVQPAHVSQPNVNSGIPSSLKSQLASSTPEASGARPPESAMSSIEPVKLPEAAMRELLSQPVDPEYPAAAKAAGQRGIVVLQVLVGRDGVVQEAKFLQGSLIFARSAIDAVKQWKFKPYSMNGRPVSVQGLITLNFKPPA